MEELQDAIEDAQYVNAIATQEDGPRPVLPWEVPTEEQLHQWESSLQKQQEQNCPIWDVDSTLSTAIGFFLFSKYVKEKENDYSRMNFCEDVIRFKKMRGLPRLEKMNTMIQLYLTNPPEKDQETGEFVELPPRTEIDEYDLEREIPSLRLTTEQFRLLYKITMDYPTCSESNVGLKGAARSELFLKLRELEDTLHQTRSSTLVRYNSEENITAGAAARLEAATPPSLPTRSASPPKPTAVTVTPPVTPTQSPVRLADTKLSLNSKSEMVLHTSSLRGLTARLRSNSAHRLSRDVFDKAEAIIMESLRRDYWEKFKESEEFARLKNFLWYQDRRVVPEDFFVMRVLGRGGFGLVTGMYSVV
jgi:beta-adrenergic-receptor kinase